MQEKRVIKYCALGDSITYGFIPRNYPGYPGQLESYAALAAKKLGFDFYNFGISDSTIANLAGHDPMCLRYADMPDDADIITVMGGTNDVRCGVPLGKMSDRCNTTFYGALHTLCQGLLSKYMENSKCVGNIENLNEENLKKKIIILTPIKLLDADKSSLPDTPQNNSESLYKWDSWIAAIKEVAAFYSLPVLDMYNNSGINPHLNRTIKGYEDGYFGYYNPLITDGTHPTQEGAELMAQALVKMLRSNL